MEEAMRSFAAGPLTPRDQQNMRAFSYWVVALAASLSAGTVIIEARWLRPDSVGWVFPVAALLFAAMTVRSYVIFIRNTDELVRRIHLEGLAWGMGAALVFMPVYRLCERMGAPKMDSVDPLLVIVLVWAIGHWRGLRHYAFIEEPAE
jgi:hypothetical protein